MESVQYVIDVSPITIQRNGQWQSKKFRNHFPSLFFADFICRGGSLDALLSSQVNGHVVTPVIDYKDGSYAKWEPRIIRDFTQVVTPMSLSLIDEHTIKQIPVQNIEAHPLYETWMKFLNRIPIDVLRQIDKGDLSTPYPNIIEQHDKVVGLTGTLSCSVAELLVYVTKLDLARQRGVDTRERHIVLVTGYPEEYVSLYGASSVFRAATPVIEEALNQTFDAQNIRVIPFMYLTSSGKINPPEYNAEKYGKLSQDERLEVYLRNILWVSATAHAIDHGTLGSDLDIAREKLYRNIKTFISDHTKEAYQAAHAIKASLTDRVMFYETSQKIHNQVIYDGTKS